MKKFFINLWAKIVEIYGMYSSFIHGIFPDQLGDLVEGLLDIAVVCLLVKLIASAAFHTKTGEN